VHPFFNVRDQRPGYLLDPIFSGALLHDKNRLSASVGLEEDIGYCLRLDLGRKVGL